MDKTKSHETLSGTPIAKRVVAKLRRHQRGKVVDIKNFVDGYAMAEGLQKTIVSQNELAALDPAHAAYVYTHEEFCQRGVKD